MQQNFRAAVMEKVAELGIIYFKTTVVEHINRST